MNDLFKGVWEGEVIEFKFPWLLLSAIISLPSFLAGDEARNRINRVSQKGSAMCQSSVSTSLTTNLFQLDLLVQTLKAPAGNGW